jgi:hypothetical protein
VGLFKSEWGVAKAWGVVKGWGVAKA